MSRITKVEILDEPSKALPERSCVPDDTSFEPPWTKEAVSNLGIDPAHWRHLKKDTIAAAEDNSWKLDCDENEDLYVLYRAIDGNVEMQLTYSAEEDAYITHLVYDDDLFCEVNRVPRDVLSLADLLSDKGLGLLSSTVGFFSESTVRTTEGALAHFLGPEKLEGLSGPTNAIDARLVPPTVPRITKRLSAPISDEIIAEGVSALMLNDPEIIPPHYASVGLKSIFVYLNQGNWRLCRVAYPFTQERQLYPEYEFNLLSPKAYAWSKKTVVEGKRGVLWIIPCVATLDDEGHKTPYLTIIIDFKDPIGTASITTESRGPLNAFNIVDLITHIELVLAQTLVKKTEFLESPLNAVLPEEAFGFGSMPSYVLTSF